MNIQNQHELQVAREKLRVLTERYEKLKDEPADKPRSREWTLRSLKQFINQFIEEIARFEAQASSKPEK